MVRRAILMIDMGFHIRDGDQIIAALKALIKDACPLGLAAMPTGAKISGA